MDTAITTVLIEKICTKHLIQNYDVIIYSTFVQLTKNLLNYILFKEQINVVIHVSIHNVNNQLHLFSNQNLFISNIKTNWLVYHLPLIFMCVLLNLD